MQTREKGEYTRSRNAYKPLFFSLCCFCRFTIVSQQEVHFLLFFVLLGYYCFFRVDSIKEETIAVRIELTNIITKIQYHSGFSAIPKNQYNPIIIKTPYNVGRMMLIPLSVVNFAKSQLIVNGF